MSLHNIILSTLTDKQLTSLSYFSPFLFLLSLPIFFHFGEEGKEEKVHFLFRKKKSNTMREKSNVHYSVILTILLVVCVSILQSVYADNPYRYYTWKITYGNIYPLGIKQQVYNSSVFMFLGFSLRLFFLTMVAGNLD